MTIVIREFLPLRIVGKYIKYIYYYLFDIKVIHCVGDSHTEIFNYYRENRIFKYTVFKVFSVSGATALGINNFNSVTKSRLLIDEYLKYVLKNHTLSFCLGEVDCGYLIWERAKRRKTSINYQLTEAIKNYKNFLSKIHKRGFKNIIVYSIPLPTVKNVEGEGLVSKLRKNVKVCFRKRTDITIKFNNLLENYCINKNFIFLNISSSILNNKTKLIDRKYINPNRLDHHLYNKNVIPIITKDLNKIGYK